MLRRLVMIVVMVAVAIPVAASPCWACSCASTGDPASDRRQHARNADVIFTGVARRVWADDPTPDDGVTGDETIYARFSVGKVYKGRDRNRAVINAGPAGNTCRFDFEEGERYTVFATRRKGELHTNLCSGTKKGRIDPDRYGLDD